MRRPGPLEPAQGTALRKDPPEERATRTGKEGDYLSITISLALLLAVVVFLLCKYAGLRIWHAAVCIILGFYLASTSIAPYITQFTASLTHSL